MLGGMPCDKEVVVHLCYKRQGTWKSSQSCCSFLPQDKCFGFAQVDIELPRDRVVGEVWRNAVAVHVVTVDAVVAVVDVVGVVRVVGVGCVVAVVGIVAVVTVVGVVFVVGAVRVVRVVGVVAVVAVVGMV